MQGCKESGLLLSLHLKATMMKISDPIFFGHCVSVFFKDAFEKHAATFKELGVNPNNGLEALFKKLQTLPEEKRQEIKCLIPDRCYAGIYQECVSFCKENGKFDVAT